MDVQIQMHVIIIRISATVNDGSCLVPDASACELCSDGSVVVSDDDNDGICNDVDTCTGALDACGVCNGDEFIMCS